MKFNQLFFFTLIVIFTITVQADDHYDQWPCEKVFNVKSCSECQKLIYDDYVKKDDCATLFNIVKKVMETANQTKFDSVIDLYKKSVNDYCDKPFYCEPNSAEESYTKLESTCADELKTKVDWSHARVDWSTGEVKGADRTVFYAYISLLTYYFGIPDHKSTCHKSSYSDELCSVEVAKEFYKAVDNDTKATTSLDFKYIIKSDGTSIPFPKEIICGECIQSSNVFYKEWINDHKLKPEIVENIWGSYEELANFFSCQKSHARDFIRRSLPAIVRF